jgi:hypothetical protein
MKLFAFLTATLLVSGSPVNKKQQLLNICREYMPAQYAFLEAYDEASVNKTAAGDSLPEYLNELPTLIHEGNHQFNNDKGPASTETRYYFTTGDEKFILNTFPVFPSSELNALAPAADKKKIFRYNTYITSKTPFLDSRVNGIFGLLEEMNAYYHSMNCSLSLFDYYEDHYGFSDPDVWVRWLGAIASYRYALNEFSIFISWYLQTAKAKHPAVFNRICSNVPIKTMYQFLHRQNIQQQQLFNKYLEKILDRFGNNLYMNNGAIYARSTGRGFGLGDDRLQQTQSILNKPEHRILDVLLR